MSIRHQGGKKLIREVETERIPRGENPTGGLKKYLLADIVDADGMRYLGMQQRHHVNPRREGPALLIDPMFLGHMLRHVPGN